jgi:hypothetical protein
VKVGDLVELSAQGKKLLWLKPLHDSIGVIISSHWTRYKVQWLEEKKLWHTVDRRSIKHAKSKK